MARAEFNRDLGQLESELVLLGALVESAIYSSLNALKTRDLDLSRQVIHDDDLIDEKRHEVEDTCLDLIRREAPVAGDLRRIISMLHIAGELERMGDYAEGIAKISLMMGPQQPLKELIDIPAMGERAVGMLKHSLDA
ncbi:MAG: PhoU domain-containing protein, partial [Dehalococcoidia bacterium]